MIQFTLNDKDIKGAGDTGDVDGTCKRRLDIALIVTVCTDVNASHVKKVNLKINCFLHEKTKFKKKI